jgi:hypothetical protein
MSLSSTRIGLYGSSASFMPNGAVGIGLLCARCAKPENRMALWQKAKASKQGCGIASKRGSGYGLSVTKG